MEEAHKPASSEGGEARGEKFTKGQSSAASSSPTPVEDDEGTKVDAGEVKDSMLKAYVRKRVLYVFLGLSLT